MKNSKLGLSILGIVILILLFGCLYTVHEGTSALVLRFGKIDEDKQGNPVVQQPGLHGKLPLVDRVYRFDMRLQTIDVQSSRFLTTQQKNVIVDYYAQWRISDLPLFYKRTGGDMQRAETLLEQQLNDGLRAEFGRRTLSEAVSDDRAVMMQTISDKADQSANRLGIEVVDVRIKRIDLPDNVSAAVYARMRVERERAATEYRAVGKAQSEAIRANADAEATVKVATAQASASKVRGQGDAEAAKIYADAYGKDASFYGFYRSLLAYTNTFNQKNDVMLLTPDGQFFKYFNSASGKSSSGQRKTQ
ncbi:MAG: protease modulator HflC [Legionellales bacterium]|nr:protease modulator HflC [Legionellales bacterium]|tara:strand:+ start:11752 stop:12666 length:915 start_codon:yes stop_codon:yes gene_type:complete